MSILKVDHIGVMVHDLEKGIAAFSMLGLRACRQEILPDFNCRIAFIPCGELNIELVQPLSPGTGTAFLQKHGEGLHHICYAVEDLRATHAYAAKHLSLRDDGIRVGAEGKNVFFVRPESMAGVISEFIQEEGGAVDGQKIKRRISINWHP